MIRDFFEQRMTRNTEFFWLISAIYVVCFHGYFSVNYYSDFYYSLLENDVVMYIGTIGSYIAALIGVVMYGFWIILKSNQPCVFRWYDFVFAQLSGIVAVFLYGLLLVGLSIALIAGLIILIFKIFAVILGG